MFDYDALMNKLVNFHASTEREEDAEMAIEAINAIDELMYLMHYFSTCDTCYYFGGCMCDHIDAEGNCLGWKPINEESPEERKAYDIWMDNALKVASQVKEEMDRRSEWNTYPKGKLKKL